MTRIAVLGVGLIGGSIGLAARERLRAEVAGYDPAAEAVSEGLALGALSVGCTSVAEAVAGASAVFVAAPVGVLAGVVRSALDVAADDCLVTDVGSTKRAVVAATPDSRFIGGHPLAGAETAGVRHARASLFEGATWYLTPTAATEGVMYERLHRALVEIGARPSAIDAETHDRMMASISHLPHVLANVLVSQASGLLSEQNERLPAAGPSFRDMTRVAGASTAIWRDIYLANADALGAAIDDAIARLENVRGALDDGAWLGDWNDGARDDRRRLLESDLAGGPVHELRVSVPNRPGVIAEIALALGRGGVNIVDMALYPAADWSEGTVALWIAGNDDTVRAVELLASLELPVVQA